MKKTYIFFASTIDNVGGAQLYVLTKSKYLQENGWRVVVFYYLQGKRFLTDFDAFETHFMQELHLPAYYFPAFKRKKAIAKILVAIGNTMNSGETIIESHSLSLATWAEVIASRIGCRHIAYNIDEKPKCTPEMLNYYKFKYNRRELFGIAEPSLLHFFKDIGFVMAYGSTFLTAYGASNCVQDIPYDLSLYKSADYTVGLFGRLEKPYMVETREEIRRFIETHKDKQFNVIYIGGASDNGATESKVKKSYIDVPNVNLYFTGYMAPVPLQLVKSLDVCVASAGASWNIARSGVPTITINPIDLSVNGVLGVTTTCSLYSEKGNGKSLSETIEDVFCAPGEYIADIPQGKHDFHSHFEKFALCNKEMVYDTSYLKAHSFRLLLKRIYLTFFDVEKAVARN